MLNFIYRSVVHVLSPFFFFSLPVFFHAVPSRLDCLYISVVIITSNLTCKMSPVYKVPIRENA
jgi:hypothetical protein